MLLGASVGAPDSGLARQVTVAIIGYIVGCAWERAWSTRRTTVVPACGPT